MPPKVPHPPTTQPNDEIAKRKEEVKKTDVNPNNGTFELRAEEEEADAKEITKVKKEMGNQKLPILTPPEVSNVILEDKERNSLVEDLLEIQHSVDNNIPIPPSLNNDQLSVLLDGVLKMKQKPEITLRKLLLWSLSNPAIACQLPPLVSELPESARLVLQDEAHELLTKVKSKNTTEKDIYLQLFRAAVNLPPQMDMLNSKELLTVSKYLPYGSSVGMNNEFAPTSLQKQQLVNIRAVLRRDDNAIKELISNYTGDLPQEVEDRINKDTPPEGFVFTKTTVANVRDLCKCLQSNIPLLIEGDTGTGKTVSVSVAAEILRGGKKEGKETNIIRFNLSSGTTIEDLIGRMQPENGKLTLSRQPFTKSFSEGLILVLDECNLAQEEVLATLESALDTGILVVPDPSNPARATKEIYRHKDFRLIITQNPCSGLYRGKRQVLSPAFLSRFFPLTLADPIPTSELIEIAQAKLIHVVTHEKHSTRQSIPEKFWYSISKEIIEVHNVVKSFCERPILQTSSLTVFSMRDIINFVYLVGSVSDQLEDVDAVCASIKKRFPEAAWCLYRARFLQKDARDKIWKELQEKVTFVKLPDSAAESPEPESPTKKRVADKEQLPLPRIGQRVWFSEQIAAPAHPIVVTKRILNLWKQLDYAMELQRPVLVVGESGSGVSAAVLGYAAYRAREFFLCHVTSETTSGTLIGQNVVRSKEKRQQNPEKIHEWRDGPATAAIASKKWLLLDDLPAATATVLERLNPLLEENPELFVADRSPEETTLNGAPTFRVLATAAPSQLGSLSPAFANRFTVICFDALVRDKVGSNQDGGDSKQDDIKQDQCVSRRDDDCSQEIRTLLKNMFFAPPDMYWFNCGKSITPCRNRIEHGPDEGYANAIADNVLSEDFIFKVKMSKVNGGSVGLVISNDVSDINQPTAGENNLSLCVYSNHGWIIKTENGKPTGKLQVDEFKDGDTIKVDYNSATESVTFSLNGAVQKCVTLQGFSTQKEASLRPFVGLFTADSSAVIYQEARKVNNKDDMKIALNTALNMSILHINRTSLIAHSDYGLATIVKAIIVGRRISQDEGKDPDVRYLTQAYNILVGVQEEDSQKSSVGRTSSLQNLLSSRRKSNYSKLARVLDAKQLPPALQDAGNCIVWSTSVEASVLIIDDYGWDLKTRLSPGYQNVTATEKSTLSEWLGTMLPTALPSGKLEIIVHDGPLKKSLNDGSLLVLEGMSALPSSLESQLLPLLDTGVLSRPGEDDPTRAMPGFCLAAICTSWESQRLSKKFISRFTRIRLPQPGYDDYMFLLSESFRDSNNSVISDSSKLISKLATKLQESSNTNYPMSVRIFSAVSNRMKKLKLYEEQLKDHILWAQCYTSIVLSPCFCSRDLEPLIDIFVDVGILSIDDTDSRTVFENKIKEPSSFANTEQNTIKFTSMGLTCEVDGNTSFSKFGETKLQTLIDTIVAVAHSSVFNETLLLTGPSSCKSLAVEEYTKMIKLNISTIHLTCSTSESDLLGSVSPFSGYDFKAAIDEEFKALESRKNLTPESEKNWRAYLNNRSEILQNVKGKNDSLSGATIFSLSDGPLSCAAKQGQGMLLKGANLPNEGVFTSLMSLFRLRELNFGVRSPDAPLIPLEKGAPLVLTITSVGNFTPPPVLETFTVKRIVTGYTNSEMNSILKSFMGHVEDETTIEDTTSKCSTPEEKEAIALLIQDVETANIRAAFRWAEFVQKYSKISGVTLPEALLIGAQYLLDIPISDYKLETIAKWKPEHIKTVRESVILPELQQDTVSVKDLIAPFNEHTDIVKLVAKKDGPPLTIARCYGKLEDTKNESKMIPTTSMLTNLARIFASSVLGTPLLLEGDPGIGKSFIIKSAADILSCSFERIQFSAGTSMSYLFGGPVRNNETKGFENAEGVLTAAVNKANKNKESWILFDELNLAPLEIQQALTPMLSPGTEKLPVPGTGKSLPLHNVRCFAAVNPASVGGGRSKLPPSVKDLFTVISLKEGHREISNTDALHIIEQKHLKQLDLDTESVIYKQLKDALSDVHTTIQGHVHEKRDLGSGGSKIINLRTLEKVALLLGSRLGQGESSIKLNANKEEDIPHIKQFFFQIIDVVYKWKFRSEGCRNKVQDIIKSKADAIQATYDTIPKITAMGYGGTIRFGNVALPRGSAKSASIPLPPSAESQCRLCALASASVSSLAVLLEGPSGSGKTALIREFARICGQTLQLIPITPNTEIGELLGMWVPWKGSDLSGNIKSLASEIAKLAALYTTGSQVGKYKKSESKKEEATVDKVREVLSRILKVISKFKPGADAEILRGDTVELCGLMGNAEEKSIAIRAQQLRELMETGDDGFHFAESQLVRAMQEGDWVLLDNIDWAPPATIERLNSLLEANATFKLGERGCNEPNLEKGAGIHPNFRIFFTSNPDRKHASALSSAFHNRVITLSLSSLQMESIGCFLFGSFSPSSDQISLWQYIASKFHSRCCEIDSRISVRTLQHCLSIWKTILQSSTNQPALYLLCGILIRAYLRSVNDKHKTAVIGTLRDVLTEVQLFAFPEEIEVKKQEEAKPKPEDKPKEEVEIPPERAPQVEPEEEKLPEVNTPSAEENQAPKSEVKDDEVRLREFSLAHLQKHVIAPANKSDNETSFCTDEEQLSKIALDLENMWMRKGTILEELCDNLVFPAGSKPRDVIANLCANLEDIRLDFYSHLSTIQILVLKLYTMEWSHVDEFVGFKDVVLWKPGMTTAQEKHYEIYKGKYHGKRNISIYYTINAALRVFNDKEQPAADRYEARAVLTKWINFIFILITLCDSLGMKVTLYRRIAKVNKESMASFINTKVKDIIAFPGATSTSTTDSESFKDKFGNVAFVINGLQRGLEARYTSNFEGEKEILIPPCSTFKVVSVDIRNNDDITINLKACKIWFWDTPSLRPCIDRMMHNSKRTTQYLQQLRAYGSKSEGSLCPLNQNLTFVEANWLAKIKKQTEKCPKNGKASATVEYFSHNDSELDTNIGEFATAVSNIANYRCNNVTIRSSKLNDKTKQFFMKTADGACQTLQSYFLKNVFTRSEAATSGVEIYIPGLIRAIITNFTYNKIFGSKTAGGACSYNCVIIFDAGVIKRNPKKAYMYLKIFARLRASMAAADVEPCVLLHGYKSIYCIHADTPWDDISSFTFLTHLQKMDAEDTEDGCLHVNPLQHAISMLLEMKGKKKVIFIITDGCGISRSQHGIAEALQFGEMNGIEVTGVGMGSEVHFAIPRAVSVEHPSQLSQGLEALIQGSWKLPEQGECEESSMKIKFWSYFTPRLFTSDGDTLTLDCSLNTDNKTPTANPAENSTAGDTWTITATGTELEDETSSPPSFNVVFSFGEDEEKPEIKDTTEKQKPQKIKVNFDVEDRSEFIIKMKPNKAEFISRDVSKTMKISKYPAQLQVELNSISGYKKIKLTGDLKSGAPTQEDEEEAFKEAVGSLAVQLDKTEGDINITADVDGYGCVVKGIGKFQFSNKPMKSKDYMCTISSAGSHFGIEGKKFAVKEMIYSMKDRYVL